MRLTVPHAAGPSGVGVIGEQNTLVLRLLMAWIGVGTSLGIFRGSWDLGAWLFAGKVVYRALVQNVLGCSAGVVNKDTYYQQWMVLPLQYLL